MTSLGSRTTHSYRLCREGIGTKPQPQPQLQVRIRIRFRHQSMHQSRGLPAVRQRYVEGFDLLPDPLGAPRPSLARFRRGRVPLPRFGRLLQRLRARGIEESNGATLDLFEITLPVTAMRLPPNGATVSGTSVLLDASWNFD